MPAVQALSVWIPPAIETGLSTGGYTRWGSVIRHTKGHEGAGQIVRHLKEVQLPDRVRVPSLPTAPAQLLQLTQVAAAASVLNLGVSVVGFMVMNAKLNELQRSVDALAVSLASMEEGLHGRLDRIDAALVELRYLAFAGLDQGRKALARLEAMEQRMLNRQAAVLGARLDAFGRGAPGGLEDMRTAILEVKLALAQELVQPPREPGRWPQALYAYRLWCMAVVLESAVLRQAGETARAASAMADAAQRSRILVAHWRDLIAPEELGGVFGYWHSHFEGRIPAERRNRLIRTHEGTDLLAEVARERTALGGEALARALPSLDDRWFERQLEGASLLDFLEETTERLESRHWELDELQARRIPFDEWEASLKDTREPALLLVDMETM